MEINPLNIFMFLLRMAPTILAIVIVVVFTLMLGTEIRTDDAERASVELAENLFASQLTAGKYVFNEHMLDSFNQKDKDRKTELPFLRSCGYGYFAEIKDLQTGKEWEFGYDPPSLRGSSPAVSPHSGSDSGIFPYIINSPERLFFASIQDTGGRGYANYYGTARQAQVNLVIYETWLTRATCAIERAFALKETFFVFSACDKSPTEFCTFSLKRHPDNPELACIFAKSGSGLEEFDCRYLPADVRFEQFDAVFGNQDPTRLKITAYPIKEGATIPGCADVGVSSALAGKGDNVQTVLLCSEKIGQSGSSGGGLDLRPVV